MNCKPGDLAIIVAAFTQSQHIGKIVRCIHLSEPMFRRDDGPCWRTEPRLKNVDGGFIAWHDAHLRPIRDQPGEDETLTWQPVPSEVTA